MGAQKDSRKFEERSGGGKSRGHTIHQLIAIGLFAQPDDVAQSILLACQLLQSGNSAGDVRKNANRVR